MSQRGSRSKNQGGPVCAEHSSAVSSCFTQYYEWCNCSWHTVFLWFTADFVWTMPADLKFYFWLSIPGHTSSQINQCGHKCTRIPQGGLYSVGRIDTREETEAEKRREQEEKHIKYKTKGWKIAKKRSGETQRRTEVSLNCSREAEAFPYVTCRSFKRQDVCAFFKPVEDLHCGDTRQNWSKLVTTWSHWGRHPANDLQTKQWQQTDRFGHRQGAQRVPRNMFLFTKGWA